MTVINNQLKRLQNEIRSNYGLSVNNVSVEPKETGSFVATLRTRDEAFSVKGEGKTQEAAITAAFNRARTILENPLFLDTLTITNFRAFRQLQVNRLGHVNLIVGKNNIGKTCLLEALWLYASFGAPEVIKQILTDRNELFTRTVTEKPISSVKYLFYGRKSPKSSDSIIIGPPGQELTLQMISLDGAIIEQLTKTSLLPDFEQITTLINEVSTGQLGKKTRNWLEKGSHQPLNQFGEAETILVVKQKQQFRLINESLNNFIATEFKQAASQFIASNGLSNEQIIRMWNEVYLTDLQDDVEGILRIIEPTIKNVGLVKSLEEDGRLIPQARISGTQERVLLSSLGEGMNRLFSLALALVSARNGFLLVDEIGNGIHYSVQYQLWNFIFAVAHRLNIQIFATTHSWDAVEAFQQAAQEHQEIEGMLISLRSKQGSPGEVVGTLFNETDLAYITRQQIEVR